MSTFRYKRWEHGTFRVLLRTGGEFFFIGSVRFSHDAEGFIEDWQIESEDVLLLPSIRDVSVIIRIGGE